FERLLRAFRFSSSAARSAAEGGGGGVPAPVPPGRPFQVLVAGIEGDPDGGLQQALPDLLEIAEIMNAKKLARFIGDPTRDPPLTPYQSYQEGCRTATETEADLLIWGLCDAEAGLLYLRFAAPGLHAHAHEDDRIGAPGALTFLTLPFLAPSQLDEPWVTLLRCVVLAAMDPRSETHVQILAENLPAFTEAAQAIGTAPPQEYTPLEQAGVLTCYANAAATVGNHAGGSDWYGLAVDCYGAAIGLLPREADGEWAALHRAVGVVLQAMGERNGDLEALQQAADAYGAALEAMLPKETPREWAALQNRMGMVRFKLHMAAGELDALRQPVSDLQAALQIYNRSEHPYRWAEVINNLAQVLQVYGDHLRSTEVLQRAVDCCHQALEVRRFEAQPLLWAVTQNNLGSALFMLAKHTQKREFLEEAREAFQKALGTYKLHNVKRLAAVAKKNLRRVDGLLESKEMREVVDPEWALPQTVEVGEQDWIDADEGASERAPGKKGAS
ncbi:MAG: cyclic nucleotide-binding protein, partial [Rhodospirillaceae bacterium]